MFSKIVLKNILEICSLIFCETKVCLKLEKIIFIYIILFLIILHVYIIIFWNYYNKTRETNLKELKICFMCLIMWFKNNFSFKKIEIWFLKFLIPFGHCYLEIIFKNKMKGRIIFEE